MKPFDLFSLRRPWKPAMLLTALAAAALTMAIAGCGEDLPRPEIVEKLRVLGVRADRPEIALDELFTAEVRMDALVADPKGAGRPITYAWGVCGFEIGGSAFTEFDCTGPRSAIPGSPEKTWTFRVFDAVTATIAAIPELRDNFASRPPGSGGGSTGGSFAFPKEGIPVLVSLKVTAGEESVTALKRVIIREKPPLNGNPRLAGVLADKKVLTPGAVNLLESGRFIKLDPVPVEGSAEPYPKIQLDGSTKLVGEDLVYSFYTTAGRLDSFRSAASEDSDASIFQTPVIASGDTANLMLWVVMRDARGGIDWLEFPAELVNSGQLYPQRQVLD
ncbi:MAG: hypothetical protein GMKNLPBB_02572 [Myxococcota bacterium]|nr:hypothetical protein [Myxococcota bacterium]